MISDSVKAMAVVAKAVSRYKKNLLLVPLRSEQHWIRVVSGEGAVLRG